MKSISQMSPATPVEHKIYMQRQECISKLSGKLKVKREVDPGTPNLSDFGTIFRQNPRKLSGKLTPGPQFEAIVDPLSVQERKTNGNLT